MRASSLLLFLLPAYAQQLASFDAASASSAYSTKSFGADLAVLESSGPVLSVKGSVSGDFFGRMCGPGIGAVLGAFLRHLGDDVEGVHVMTTVAGIMVQVKLSLGQGHSRQDGRCWG